MNKMEELKTLKALHDAVFEGDEQTLVTLLDRDNSDVVSANDNGRTLLHTAAETGNEKIVDILVERGAPINPKDKSGNVPLLSACVNRHYGVMQQLLELGADASTRNNHGHTPLHYTATLGSVEMSETLIDFGAVIDPLTDMHNTPLHFATMYNHGSIVLNLLELGADVNQLDMEGRNVLHLAMVYERSEMVWTFLACGADFNIKDNNGETTYDLAEKHCHKHVLDLLKAVRVQRKAIVERATSKQNVAKIGEQLQSLERQSSLTFRLPKEYKIKMIDKLQRINSVKDPIIEALKEEVARLEERLKRLKDERKTPEAAVAFTFGEPLKKFPKRM